MQGILHASGDARFQAGVLADEELQSGLANGCASLSDYNTCIRRAGFYLAI